MTSWTWSLQQYAPYCDSVWRPAQIETLVKSLCVVRWSRRSITDSDETRQTSYVAGAAAVAAAAESIAVDIIRTDGTGEGRTPERSDAQNTKRKKNK